MPMLKMSHYVPLLVVQTGYQPEHAGDLALYSNQRILVRKPVLCLNYAVC